MEISECGDVGANLLSPEEDLADDKTDIDPDDRHTRTE
jgi:hypothetical protein